MKGYVLLFLAIGCVGAAPALAAESSSSSSSSAAGSSSSSPSYDGDHAGTQSAEIGDYRIGAEDVLDISVWNNSAISRTVPVRPDGKISLPLVNDVQAAGLTPAQLRSVLIKKLAEYIPSPEVSVIVREVHSFKVSVIGEVKKTGRHELKGRATVLDILAMAEGFGEFAGRNRIVVLRPEGKSMRQIPFNYNKVISTNGGLENFFLQPGDIIVVP
ncbi:polysaccharide biosynthesis/export family protein [Nitrospira moscoviensis]|uniref:Polysaccharide export protein (Modular protein) n=1 Tax=Nitrospira moscoviensis TaxID=42253 RepID=A0A0K2GDY3_NITMO|nr:polysaccharide biosynthesis/export family protein [Nitrospira moscoviensis]ALA59064.1 Polysaccharide export protein (modular protein) [Nitrospira moscoviensis]